MTSEIAAARRRNEPYAATVVDNDLENIPMFLSDRLHVPRELHGSTTRVVLGQLPSAKEMAINMVATIAERAGVRIQRAKVIGKHVVECYVQTAMEGDQLKAWEGSFRAKRQTLLFARTELASEALHQLACEPGEPLHPVTIHLSSAPAVSPPTNNDA